MLFALRRLIASFSPRQQPLMTRQGYAYERGAAFCLPVAVAMLDGAVAGVLLKKIFYDPAAPKALELPFAFIMACPFMANLTSYLWAVWARGRPKIALMNKLHAGILLCVAGVAFLPTTTAGAWGLVLLTLACRCLIAGAVTLRSAIWRLNYPRKNRAQVTSKLVVIMSFGVAMAPILAYPLLDIQEAMFRLIYPLAACIGIAGLWSFSKIRVRREAELLKQEQSHKPPEALPPEALPPEDSPPEDSPQDALPPEASPPEALPPEDSPQEDSPQDALPPEASTGTRAPAAGPRTPIIAATDKPLPSGFWSVLRDDRDFRFYQLWQFVLGASNILSETVVIYFIAQFTRGHAAEYSVSIFLGITTPMLVALVFMPLWAKYLDRVHIAEFRSRHALFFVAAQLCYIAVIGLLLSGPGSGLVARLNDTQTLGLGHGQWLAYTLLLIPRVVQGVARGGGMLAWNLGHHDFADRRLVSIYMGIHVTLTGIRGAVAPFLGVLLLSGWTAHDLGPFTLPAFDGLGVGVFVVGGIGSFLAWFGFLRLYQSLKSRGMLNTQQD